MTREEKLAELDRQWDELMRMPFPPKPVEVVSVPLKAADAAVVRAKPESVRVVAEREDGVVAIIRPVANPNQVMVRVDLVREVDALGRPIWHKARIEHEYSPLDRLS